MLKGGNHYTNTLSSSNLATLATTIWCIGNPLGQCFPQTSSTERSQPQERHTAKTRFQLFGTVFLEQPSILFLSFLSGTSLITRNEYFAGPRKTFEGRR
nr:unnamed protein product [Haemonchus contortus]